MATIEVSATSRALQGTGASRRLRGTGKVPGIIYGGDHPAQNVEFDHNALVPSAQAGSLPRLHPEHDRRRQEGARAVARCADASLEAIDPARRLPARVGQPEDPHEGAAALHQCRHLPPGVKTGGGIVSHVMNEMDITCLPDDLPEFIEVDLQTLEIGAVVHLADLKIPKGVESVQLTRGDNAVVATVQIPRAMVEPEPAVAVAGRRRRRRGRCSSRGCRTRSRRRSRQEPRRSPRRRKAARSNCCRSSNHGLPSALPVRQAGLFSTPLVLTSRDRHEARRRIG